MTVTFSQYAFLYHFEHCKPVNGNMRSWVANIYDNGDEKGKELSRLFKHIVSSGEVTDNAPVRELAEIIRDKLLAHIKKDELSDPIKQKALKRIKSFEILQKKLFPHINQLSENSHQPPFYALSHDFLHELLVYLSPGDIARFGRTYKQGREVFQKAKELPQSPVFKKLVQKAVAEKKYDDLIALFKTRSNNNCQQTSNYPIELEFPQNIDTETQDMLFSFFTNVKKLHFANDVTGRIKDIAPDLFEKMLNSLKNLEDFCPSRHIPFTVAQLEKLFAQCTKLMRLDLEHESDDVHRAFLQAPSIPSLKFLNLANAVSFSANELTLLVEKYPNLEELNMSNWKNAPNRFEELSKLKFLRSLKLQHVSIPDKQTLNVILTSCPNLQELDITDTYDMRSHPWQDTKTKLISSNILRSLTLAKQFINDEDLDDIVQSFPNLEVFNLSGCSTLATGLEKLARLVHLQSVNFRCTDINAKALDTIAIQCPSIKTLYLHCCFNLVPNVALT